MDERDILLEDEEWEHYGFKEPHSLEGGEVVPKLRGDFYKKNIDGTEFSYGIFKFNGETTHRAWGVKTAPHCSYHQLYDAKTGWGDPVKGCADTKAIYDTEGQVVGFSIVVDGIERTWR